MVSLSSVSVLTVDDSKTMRAILRDMLSRLGARSIEEAASGEEALGLIRAKPYSLIISDINMEPIDGLEMLRRVRALSRPGQNRIIFMTTERSWSVQTSARLEGAAAFITKPFTIEALKTKIDQVLQR